MDSIDNTNFSQSNANAANSGVSGMNANLGAIPLSVDILEKANIGLWAFELDEGEEPRMYVDNVMLGLIGLTEQTTPEKTYHAWYDHIDPEHYNEVTESVEKMMAGIHSEVQYPWHHPDGHVMIVRCGGVRNSAYTKGIRIEGTHMDVTEVLHVEKNKDTLLDGLAREYHTVWLMDGFGDHKVHLYRSTGKTTVQSAVKLGLDEPCYDTSVVKYVMNSVHEDDRERVLEATKFETVERETPDVGTYVVTYKRYNDQGKIDYHQMCFAKAISSDGVTNYIMAYRDADKTMREQLRRQEQMEQFNKITNALAADYSSVYVVNLADSSLYPAKMSGRITGMFGDSFKYMNYEQANEAYVESAVCEEQKDEMRRVLAPEYVREHLKGVSSFVKYYINNNGEYTEMKVVKTDNDDEVVMGFGVKDAEIREQLAMTEEMKRNDSLVRILSDDYLSVFSLDYDTDKYTVVSKGPSNSVAQSHSSTAEAAAAMADYINNYVHPEDRKMLAEVIEYKNIKEKLAHANRYRATFRTNYDGKGYKYVDFVAGKAGDPDSPVTSIAMGFQDVDDQVRQELESRHQLETQMARVMKLSDDFQAIYNVDFETGKYDIFSYDNGYEDSVLKNNENGTNFYADTLKDVGKVVYPDDQELIISTFSNKEYIRKTLAEQGDFTIDYRLMVNGEPAWYRVKVAKTPEDEEHFLVGIFNVDKRVRKEADDKKRLEHALEEAQSANRAKTAFLNNMSHDIRTPLNAITGYTTMAKKHLDSADYMSDYLRKIDVSGHQLLELINQVLEMSRIESGKVVLQEEPADVIDRAYDMKTLSGTDIESKNLKYTVVIKDVSHRHVLADRARMNQIILNVIGNAIKYTPEGGIIDYTVEEEPCDKEGYGLYSFTVADNGIGMSEEFQKHLFEEFARENTSTVSHIQGTGLGMPIVKKLVELMGGSIDVKSKLGEGTTIKVSVPMKWDEHAANRAAENAKHLNLDFKGKRILLVEDNEMNREIARDILEEAGFAVECAEDGDVAVEMVKNNTYDAVLMDIQMPRMNGYEATRHIRADLTNRHLPIIALSANAFEEDKLKSLDAGMDDHVSKPIDIKQLKQTLAKFL